MGDMAEPFRYMNAARKERHRDWRENNMKTINNSELRGRFETRPDSILFRESGKPTVDFFPSTGRWRSHAHKKTFGGGALSFIRWYRKQGTGNEDQRG